MTWHKRFETGAETIRPGNCDAEFFGPCHWILEDLTEPDIYVHFCNTSHSTMEAASLYHTGAIIIPYWENNLVRTTPRSKKASDSHNQEHPKAERLNSSSRRSSCTELAGKELAYML